MVSVLINGEAQSVIAVSDRGMQYGDGLFETIAVRAGVPRLWERHWRRLSRGCERLGIEGVDQNALWGEACRICNGVEQGVLKLIVTRGVGGRGYRPQRSAQATRIVSIYPWPDYPDAHRREGVAVRVCATRLGRNSALAGLKHLNRLEQVLARREWDDPHIAEGLMLDDLGHVVSGTASNLFIVSAGKLVTPRINECGVEGVMRGLIRDLASEIGIAGDESKLELPDIWQAHEVFLCNALIGIWPVRRIERQDYPLGAVTRRLAERLDSLQHAVGRKED